MRNCSKASIAVARAARAHGHVTHRSVCERCRVGELAVSRRDVRPLPRTASQGLFWPFLWIWRTYKFLCSSVIKISASIHATFN